MAMATPKKTPLPYRILPATEADCHDLARIEAISFADTQTAGPSEFQIMFGSPTEAGIAFREKGFLEKLQKDPSAKFWKVVIDEVEGNQEKIVACALWHFYKEPLVLDEWKSIEWPSVANAEACEYLASGVHNMRHKYMNGRKYGYLQVLATLPEYREQGIASALLDLGLTHGINEGLREFWLSATQDGYPLYKKLGFEGVEAIQRDLTQFGAVGTSNIVGMRKVVE